ncbi:MAG: pantoate--beta-alanine ligase [Clostridiales bacterium]|nr:pantoate--beta-alanine ligase [Clostridiales bacterium]
MNIIKTIGETRKIIKDWKKSGLTVGLVPTMGFLHEGHGSLIARSVKENDRTVVSVFVNPMQFSLGEDMGVYPRDMERDSRMCQELGADLIFNPEAEEMYTKSFYSFVDMSVISEGLCGASRENMFKGVCTVVSKLFNIVTPDRAYFGKKDAQQLAVVKQMVNDLNIDIKIVGCDCVREADGLAKSSRNSYLTHGERAVAPKIYAALLQVKKMVICGEHHSCVLTESFKRSMYDEPMLQTEYAEIVDGLTMQPVPQVTGQGRCLMAVAVKLGKARLIDNIEI